MTAGASKWRRNKRNQSPAGLMDGVDGSSDFLSALHRACVRHGLLPTNLVQHALRTQQQVGHPPELGDVVDALLDNRPRDALSWAEDAMTSGVAHAEVYFALALLDNEYATSMARDQLGAYERLVPTLTNIAPMYFYVIYLLWKKNGSSKKKGLRLVAADALSACRLFPCVADDWLMESDRLDLDVEAEQSSSDLDGAIDLDDDVDDDEDEDAIEEPGADSPEGQWSTCKSMHGAKSESMEKLMKLVGLRKIKYNAVAVFKKASKHFPPEVQWATNVL